MAASRNRLSPDSPRLLAQRLREGVRAGIEAAFQPAADRRAPRTAVRCVVGLSGGMDSMALLHALAGLRDCPGAARRFEVSAVHVHHGLSSNADRWAAHCQEFCKLLAVPLQVQRVTVERRSGLGLEAAARQARYAVFSRLDADILLLAHHAGDQAETLLFNLVRGCGLLGAAAMPARRVLETHAGAMVLLRPWLEVGRADIEAYARHFGLVPVHDEGNDDQGFSRNFLRHTVLPPLASRFPGALERMAGAARRLAEAQQLTDDLADLDLATVASAGSVELAALHRLSGPRQRNALRRWMALHDLRVGEAALDELCRQMRDAQPGAQIVLSLDSTVLRVWRGALYAVPVDPVAPLTQRLIWPPSSSLDWAGGRLSFSPSPGRGIALPAGAVLEVRARQGGERIRLRAEGPSQAVKTLLQAAHAPPWLRQRLPCLWLEGVLVAVAGLGVAAGYQAQSGETGYAVVWDASPPQEGRSS